MEEDAHMTDTLAREETALSLWDTLVWWIHELPSEGTTVECHFKTWRAVHHSVTHIRLGDFLLPQIDHQGFSVAEHHLRDCGDLFIRPVDELVTYLRHHKTVTGIQVRLRDRTCLESLAAIDLNRVDRDWWGSIRIGAYPCPSCRGPPFRQLLDLKRNHRMNFRYSRCRCGYNQKNRKPLAFSIHGITRVFRNGSFSGTLIGGY